MSLTLPWLFINDPAGQWFHLYLPLALAFFVGFTKKHAAGLRGLWFGIGGLLALSANGLVHHWAVPGFEVFLVMLTIWLGGGSLAGTVGGVVRGIVDKMKPAKTQSVPPTE